MPIIGLLRRTRGYVEFTVRKGQVERLLNLCAHRGVPVWDTRRDKDGFVGCTTPDGYRDMRKLAKKAGVRTQVRKRHGLPFLAHRYRARVGILAGVLLFAIFLTVTQQFVWLVRVDGCERLDPQVLESALEELGVRRGVFKRSIDPKEVRQRITLMVDDLSWAALNIQGTTATLLIRERTPPPQKIDTTIPANVVASMDGQIVRLEVTDGKAVRKKGDTVRKGELIASGVMEDRWGLTHLTRANAMAIAHVPQSLTVEIPLMREELRPTGKISHRRYLEVCGLHLPLFLYSGLEGEYKLERMTRAPEVLGLTMPFEITRESYIFFERDQEELSEERALSVAQKELERLEQHTWGNAVLSRSYTASNENGVLTLRGDYEVEMDIAQQVEIPVLDRKAIEKARPPREGGY